MVENETYLKVKNLQPDNGGKYVNDDFQRYYDENGIKMKRTVSGNSQQNGVAERMNKILNEWARSMRLHVGLPQMFQVEAVNTATHLINRGPSTPLNFKLLKEVWSGKKVDLLYLKVFGCVSYVLIDSSARSKLDAKSKKCNFIRYGNSQLGYRLWDDQNQKIVKSKDMILNEAILYKDRTSSSEGKKPVVILLKNIPVFEIGESLGTRHPVEEGECSRSRIQETETPKEVQTTHIELLRRYNRILRPPQKYSPNLHYILSTDRGEPKSYDEAMEDREMIKWELAMKDDMDSLIRNVENS